MILTPALRKLALTTHVAASVGWLGALAVFFAHALVSAIGRDEQLARAASLAMGITAWFVILPLSFASLTSGLVQALGTAWGLFRHYWIVFKLALTSIATAVLLMKLGPISTLADAAAQASSRSADLAGLRTSLVVHAAGGLLLLLVAVTLAVYKPQGLTPYGSRKQRELRASRGTSGPASLTGMPRWAKVFGAVVLVLILMIGLMLLGGGHGPGSHLH